MFFILSKTVSIFTQPLIIVLLMLMVSRLIKPQKWRKRLFWSGFGLMLFLSNSFLSNEIMRAWEVAPRPFEDVESYDIGIVLTGVTISKTLPDDRVYFSKGADRVIHAFQLYRKGRIKKILISGGTGSLFLPGEKEAFKLQRVFKLMGVPDSDLIIEAASRNTHENATYTTRLVQSLPGKPTCLLITSGFHMRRARACFLKAGLSLDVFSADFHTSDRKLGTLFVFDLSGLLKWTILAKEWVGYTAYWVMGYI